MSVATLNIRTVPRRLLNQNEAAEYCGLKAKRFQADCAVAPVVMPNGSKLYDMLDLDRWIEGLKAGAGDSDDDIVGRL